MGHLYVSQMAPEINLISPPRQVMKYKCIEDARGSSSTTAARRRAWCAQLWMAGPELKDGKLADSLT